MSTRVTLWTTPQTERAKEGKPYLLQRQQKRRQLRTRVCVNSRRAWCCTLFHNALFVSE